MVKQQGGVVVIGGVSHDRGKHTKTMDALAKYETPSRLMRRLQEVVKIHAKITAVLQSDPPPEQGREEIVSRELMVLELDALVRDRKSLESKLRSISDCRTEAASPRLPDKAGVK